MDRRGAFGLVALTLLMLLLVTAPLAVSAKSVGAAYDQRQEGKVNVQIDVKDVQIVALLDSDSLDDYMSYDYAYDYADFTIKPKPTTSKPSSTVEVWSTWPTRPSTSSADSTSTASSTTSSSSSDSAAEDATKGSTESSTAAENKTEIVAQEATSTIEPVKSKPEEEKPQVAAESQSAVTDKGIVAEGLHKRPLAMAEPRKRCPVGFLLKSGRCFKRHLSLISPRVALIKLAPALLGKAKVLSKSLADKSS